MKTFVGTGEVPRMLPPSLNVTVPLIAPEQLPEKAPPPPLTLVASVIVVPTVEGFKLDESTNDEGRRLTISVIELVLAAVNVSPE